LCFQEKCDDLTSYERQRAFSLSDKVRTEAMRSSLSGYFFSETIRYPQFCYERRVTGTDSGPFIGMRSQSLELSIRAPVQGGLAPGCTHFETSRKEKVKKALAVRFLFAIMRPWQSLVGKKRS
jgi:hypothetical protein